MKIIEGNSDKLRAFFSRYFLHHFNYLTTHTVYNIAKNLFSFLVVQEKNVPKYLLLQLRTDLYFNISGTNDQFKAFFRFPRRDTLQ